MVTKTIAVTTRKKDQIIDLTETVAQVVRDNGSESGMSVVFAAHTTCAITTADLDPGTDLDILDALRHLLPKINYRHPHDPSHTPDHILATLLGPSVSVPFHQHELLLGVWQRIILIEFDGPRQRTVHISTY
jgi:secondary thiamine-phosphate synthase enzyme